jgi:hypothetical protein
MRRAGFRLPPGFEQLEPFVDGWALDRSAERMRRRLVSNESERTGFYLAAKDKLANALTLLDKKPLDRLDDQERCLMNLMLMLAHVSLAVEVQKEIEPEHAIGRAQIRIQRSMADAGA